MLIKQLPRKLINLHLNQRLYSTVNSNHYNIVVVGGGMIGSTLACTLGKNERLSHLNILLLENSPKINYKITERYSNRVSTLNLGTKKLLENINVWPHIENGRYAPVKHMQVWDAMSDALITFEDNNNNNNQTIAYVVENNLLLDSVYKELLKQDNVNVVYQSKIKEFRQNEEKNLMEIIMENGDTLTSDLLIGCDGVNSQVRKAMGTHYIKENYNHCGIVATIKIQSDDENTTAWQRHLPNSEVVALLPLSKNLSSLVWSVPIEATKLLMSLSDEEFSRKLEERFHQIFPTNSLVNQLTRSFDNLIKSLNFPSSQSKQIIPKILGCEQGSRAVFPLGYGHATNYIGQNYVLVGDAAHRIHPLAGQGVNLGFGDVSCLNQTLTQALLCGTTINNLSYLRKYEVERQSHNVLMMLTVHGLFKMYSTELAPVVLLRSLGLQTAHALPPLKVLIGFIQESSHVSPNIIYGGHLWRFSLLFLHINVK